MAGLRLGVASVASVFLWAASAAAADTAAPTFTKDVAPILYKNCTGCHRPGEIGPFSLITYDDVRRHATQIAAVTARRVMPPWKPAPGRGSFQNERRLSDAGKLPPPAPKGRRRVAPGKARGNAASPPPSPGGAARTCRS